MRTYLLSIVGTVLLSAVLTAVLPNGKTAGLIKGVTRLVCALVIISPILTFFQSGSGSVFETKNSDGIFSQSVIDAEETFIHYYSELRVRETEKALAQEIAEKQGVEVEVSLEWTLKNEDIRIDKIYIKTRKQEEMEVLRSVWEYLTENYCSEVLIE